MIFDNLKMRCRLFKRRDEKKEAAAKREKQEDNDLSLATAKSRERTSERASFPSVGYGKKRLDKQTINTAL